MTTDGLINAGIWQSHRASLTKEQSADVAEKHPSAAARMAAIIADPAASNWIRSAMFEAQGRDPADAANDAEIMAEVLAQRADEHAGFLTAAGRLPAKSN